MYNGYGGPPGYNRPPGYGGTPPNMGAAPGTGPPVAAPGMAPPANAYNGPPALGGPRPLPHNFQPPSGMPNINFSAPVIRLGTGGAQRGSGGDSYGGRRESATPAGRRGLGMDSHDGRRDEPKLTHPPTREELARTIFVGNIPDGVGGDKGVEAILETAGSLTRFYRVSDSNNKTQTFGFAEFGDAQSLRTATEIFKDVRVPTKRQQPKIKTEVKVEGETEEVETTLLQIFVDAASVKYAEDWTKNEDPNTIQFRIDSAKDALASVLASFFNPQHHDNNDMMDIDHDENSGVVQIDIMAGEDELADVPAEMRETVAAEIAAFRDRSNKRDLERQRKEEEIERDLRRGEGRRQSPPPSAPTGPGGVNGVPVGPRADRGAFQGAPSGPKGSSKSTANGGFINREDEDDSASDSELERRRIKKRQAEEEEAYKIELRRWMKQEERTISSLERTRDHTKHQEAQEKARQDDRTKFLKDYDDDAEASLKRQLYYRDHNKWRQQRKSDRAREEAEDSMDREQEKQELAAKETQREHARQEADAFLLQQAEEMRQAEAPRAAFQKINLNLSAASKKLAQDVPRRTAADIENLLEDEETNEQPGAKKRTLIPINYDTRVRVNLTQEEVEEAQRQLAREIPADKDGLWKWPVDWQHLTQKYIVQDIKQWAANKVLEILGIQEDMLVDTIVDELKKQCKPQDLVDSLSGALEDDAENLVKKLWRMVIWYSETEKRGIK